MRAFLSLGQGEPLPRSGIAREINLLSCASCLSSRTNSRALGKIRNALIHYRPEWDNEQKEHKKLKERLSGRFALNKHGAGLWFPHQCLGAGCAAWATNQAESFMTDFCQRLGIPNRIDKS